MCVCARVLRTFPIRLKDSSLMYNKNIVTTSAASSTNLGSTLIFVSCVIHRSPVFIIILGLLQLQIILRVWDFCGNGSCMIRVHDCYTIVLRKTTVTAACTSRPPFTPLSVSYPATQRTIHGVDTSCILHHTNYSKLA